LEVVHREPGITSNVSHQGTQSHLRQEPAEQSSACSVLQQLRDLQAGDRKGCFDTYEHDDSNHNHNHINSINSINEQQVMIIARLCLYKPSLLIRVQRKEYDYNTFMSVLMVTMAMMLMLMMTVTTTMMMLI